MRAHTLFTLFVAVVLPSGVFADPCHYGQPEGGVPTRAAQGPADFGMLPEACAATAVVLDTSAGLTIALEEFYGNVGLNASLRARLAWSDALWFSATLPGLDYRFVANASLEATQLDLGATTVAVHAGSVVSDKVQLAPYFRLLLPTETVYQSALRLGIEVGVSSVARVHPLVELVSGVSLPLFIVTHGSGDDVRLGANASVDVNITPYEWWVISLGVGARLFGGDTLEPLESVDPRIAMRFYPWEGLMVDIAARTPVLGADRTDASVSLGLGWIFAL